MGLYSGTTSELNVRSSIFQACIISCLKLYFQQARTNVDNFWQATSAHIQNKKKKKKKKKKHLFFAISTKQNEWQSTIHTVQNATGKA